MCTAGFNLDLLDNGNMFSKGQYANILWLGKWSKNVNEPDCSTIKNPSCFINQWNPSALALIHTVSVALSVCRMKTLNYNTTIQLPVSANQIDWKQRESVQAEDSFAISDIPSFVSVSSPSHGITFNEVWKYPPLNKNLPRQISISWNSCCLSK